MDVALTSFCEGRGIGKESFERAIDKFAEADSGEEEPGAKKTVMTIAEQDTQATGEAKRLLRGRGKRKDCCGVGGGRGGIGFIFVAGVMFLREY